VNNSIFEAVSLFTYPKTVDDGLNLLNEENLVFPSGYGGPPPVLYHIHTFQYYN